MRALVVGLGNPILTDDGVGVLVAQAVAHGLANQQPGQVEVIEASVGGLRLMEMMIGYDRVVLVDAWTGGDKPPGTVLRLTVDDLAAIAPTQHLASAHDATLQTALEAGRRMGLPLPDDIVIFAVAAHNVVEFGDTPSPAVGAAIPRAAEAVLAELR